MCTQKSMIKLQESSKHDHQPAPEQHLVQEDEPTIEVGDSTTHSFANAPSYVMEAYEQTDKDEKQSIEALLKLYCEFIKRCPYIKEKQWKKKLQFAVRRGTLAIFMEQLQDAEGNEMRISILMH